MSVTGRDDVINGGRNDRCLASDDYLLGTHDEEVTRLGIQHRVWRTRAQAAWHQAGFGAGKTILDVGSGPGWATFDLADLVGPSGRVIAVERSRRFLTALEAACTEHGLTQVSTIHADLETAPFREGIADGAWCRWVLAFVRHRRDLLRRVVSALKPGGVLVAHEYLDYSTWRLWPRVPEFEAFVGTLMASWRESGGEPDAGLDVLHWAGELGLEVLSQRAVVDVIDPASPIWLWPTAFMDSGPRRLAALGHMTDAQAASLPKLIEEIERTGSHRMVTPTVLEIIAVRRA